MQTIQVEQYAHVVGGEVGATGMGDDYHYTGSESSANTSSNYDSTLANCMGAFGGIDGGSALSCLWIIYDYASH